MVHFINCPSCGKQYNEQESTKCPHCGFAPISTSDTIICSNKLCGKEYHKDFKKCPFCGAENLQYDKESAEKHRQQNKDPESVGKGALRIFISIIVALIAITLLSSLDVLLNISGRILMFFNAGLAISCGVACNKYLKKKFSSPKKQHKMP